MVDANILINAVNLRAAEHSPARHWLEVRLNGSESLGFSWAVLLAFVRITTKAGVMPAPLDLNEALQFVEQWLSQPPATIINPTPRHNAVLAGLLRSCGTGGNLVSDAHLAAQAIEHGATIISFDRDFGRFDGLNWRLPSDDLMR